MNRTRWAGRKLATTILLIGFCMISPQQTGASDASERRCLAQAMYWESRSEGRDAMIGVGWVALNRQRSPDFPDTICSVVRQGGEDPPCQFSFWCDGAPEIPHNEELWHTARKLAQRMLENPPADPTGGALYFHSVHIPEPWAKPRQRTARVGDHIFYK